MPAHNEAQLIGSCLDALVRATRHAPVECMVRIVLDDCHDGTSRKVADVVARADGDIGVEVVSASAVGVARRAGAASLLRGLGIDGTWLATTDADSQVPPDWLTAQLGHARQGADVVVGAVKVADWSERHPHLAPLAERHYSRRARHVHGANLGMRAGCYAAVGGFPPVRHNEDVLLVEAFSAAGARIAWAPELVVTTSARRVGRAPAGFAGFLTTLEAAGPTAVLPAVP